MDDHEDGGDERECDHVEDVEADEGVLADLDAAQDENRGLARDERRVGRHLAAHRDGPEGDLVPRQQVAGEAQQQGHEQQDHADHPVELARRLVGPVVEDPNHVQEDRQHHQVRGPSVHVADEGAECHRVLDGEDVLVGAAHRRDVEEHQVQAGHRQHQEQEEADPSQAEGVRVSHGVPLYAHRVQVQEDVVHDRQRARAAGGRVRLAEEGSPDLRFLDGLVKLARPREAHRCTGMPASCPI